MTEPAATVVGATLSTGVATAVISQLGLEPGPLFWALAGASLGMSFAASTTRFKAAAVFIAVVLCCSLFGAWIATQFFGGALLSRNAFSCGLAILFHPLLNGVVAQIAPAIKGLRNKLGIGGD